MAGVSNILTWDDRETQAMLKKVIGRMDDLRPVMKAFGEYMLVETEKRFAGEHDPEGRPWKPLSRTTLENKEYGTKILTGRGHRGGLRGTIAYSAEKKKVAVGTSKVYGAIHQLGGKAGPNRQVTIPARPYLGITDENRQEFVMIVKDHLEGR